MTMYTLTHDGKRPPTANWSRGKSRGWYDEAKVTDEWKHAFWTRARAAKIPQLTVVEFEIIPLHATFQSPQDVGACAPAAKAAIDGIVAAMDGQPWNADKVNDGPDRVLGVQYRPPARGCGIDGLTVVVRAMADEPPPVGPTATRHLLVPVNAASVNELMRLIGGKIDPRKMGQAAGRLLDEALK